VIASMWALIVLTAVLWICIIRDLAHEVNDW
jgi:hypothetical protein